MIELVEVRDIVIQHKLNCCFCGKDIVDDKYNLIEEGAVCCDCASSILNAWYKGELDAY